MNNHNFTIEFISDDEDDFVLAKSSLNDTRNSHFNYQIKWCHSSQEGIEHIKAQSADIYIVNQFIDQKNGFDILEEVKNNNLKKPIIFLSSDDEYDIDIRAMQAGSDYFLHTKALSNCLFERTVRYCLHHSQGLH